MQPAFLLKTPEGHDVLTRLLIERTVNLSVTDAVGDKSDTISVTLDDRNGDIELPSAGQQVQLWIGYVETGLEYFGSYTIDEVSYSTPPAQISISGKAASMLKPLKAPRSKSWEETTVGQMVEEVASRAGLSAEVDPSMQNLKITHLDQSRESDMHMLYRLARRFDAVFKPTDGKLRFHRQVGARAEAGLSVEKVQIHASMGTKYSWKGAKRTKFHSVRAHYYDMEKGERVPVIEGEGAEDAETIIDVRHDVDDEASAKAVAKAQKNRLDRAQGELTITLPGDPRLKADMLVDLSGLKSGIDGTWSIKSAKHSIQGKYETVLECEPPGGSKKSGQKSKGKSSTDKADKTDNVEGWDY